MNKLGFCATATSGGFRKTHIVNGDGRWDRSVIDIRQLQGIFSTEYYLTGNYALVLSYSDGGCYITVISAIDGRQGDNVSSWIYVPREVQIGGAQLEAIVNAVIAENMKTSINKALVDQIFSTPYNQRQAIPGNASANDNSYAVRYYGSGRMPLATLLENLFQPEYAQFRFVFLLTNGVTISEQYAAAVRDISNLQIRQICNVNPPQSRDFMPYIGSVPFNQPMPFVEGSQINVTWRRQGYRDILIGATAYPGIVLSAPSPSQYERVIERGMFNITSSKNGAPVNSAKIKVNGQVVDSIHPAYVAESQLSKVKISIEAPGYKPVNNTVDLNNKTKISVPLEIGGVAHKMTYDGMAETVSFFSKTKTLPEVLRVDGVEYVSKNASKSFGKIIMSMIPGILVGAVFATCFCFVLGIGKSGSDNPKEADRVEVTDPGEETAPDYSQAREYLLNPAWSDESMKSIEGLQGLYQAMNTYNTSEIKSILSKFNDIEGPSKVLAAFEGCNESQLVANAPYSNDGSININNYCTKVRNGGVTPPTPNTPAAGSQTPAAPKPAKVDAPKPKVDAPKPTKVETAKPKVETAKPKVETSKPTPPTPTGTEGGKKARNNED